MAARELRSLTEVEEAERAERGVSYVVAPRVPEALYGKLKERVATVAVATAIFIVASAGIQGLCFILNEQHLEKNLRALAQVQAVPEITWLIGALPQLVFFPAIALLLASILTGSLFATCGLMGTKAQSECCACCYCCCSAAYCIFLIPAIVGALFFLQSVSSASETAELWFGRCDPKLCYPLGFDTPVKRQIDCLAPAVWDEYRPQFSGNHLPQECPPMYLQCEENEDTEDTKEAEVVQARRLLVEPTEEEGEDTAVSAAPVAAETVAPDQDEVEEAEPRDTRDEKGAEDEADDGDADEEPEGASEEEEVADARDSSRGQEGKNDDDDDAADVERDAGADKEESKEDDQEDEEADAAEAKQRNDDLDDDQHVSGTEEETDQDADASPETVEAASSAASSARSQAEDSEEDEEDSEKEAQEASSDEKEGSGEEDVEDPDEDDAGEEAEDAKKAEEEEEEDEKDSSESPEEDDPQSSADEVEEEEEEEEEEDPQEEVLDFSESDQGSALKALGQASESLGKVLTLPMPEDPLTECKPSRIVALYKVAQREAPDVFQALWIQTAVRLLCMVPTMVLMAFGFWWGHEYWSKLTKGNSQTYLLANVPLGQGEPRDVQMTHMSQPLMVQA